MTIWKDFEDWWFHSVHLNRKHMKPTAKAAWHARDAEVEALQRRIQEYQDCEVVKDAGGRFA